MPLFLIHGRAAVLAKGSRGSTDALRPFVEILSDQPVFLVRQAVLPPPASPGLVFDPAGEVSFRVMVLGVDAPDRGNAAADSLVSVRAFRVRLAAR